MFSTFMSNLVISNGEVISLRYGELTSALNKAFRATESKTANSLQVGSFGRRTAIKGVSDLDLLYIMPASRWPEYKKGRQLQLLQDVKAAITRRYPKTNVRVDRLVVTVTYTDFHMEVQPVFEQSDGSYMYPDTKNGGAWKVTKPKAEMDAMSELDRATNKSLRQLCKMARAWKNQHGVPLGGLLIDTLAYNFLSSTSEFDSVSFGSYGKMAHEFFHYLEGLPNQAHFVAPGSGQHVRVKSSFHRKAKKARKLASKALDSEGSPSANKKWTRVFGREFSSAKSQSVVKQCDVVRTWRRTEEHIADVFPVDIRYGLRVDCDVVQSGFRSRSLRAMIARGFPLIRGNQLVFRVVETDTPRPYRVVWKVLNRGEEARRRDEIRGQLLNDAGDEMRSERTSFPGDHVVDCYVVKNGIVVAKNRVHVPIV